MKIFEGGMCDYGNSWLDFGGDPDHDGIQEFLNGILPLRDVDILRCEFYW